MEFLRREFCAAARGGSNSIQESAARFQAHRRQARRLSQDAGKRTFFRAANKKAGLHVNAVRKFARNGEENRPSAGTEAYGRSIAEVSPEQPNYVKKDQGSMAAMRMPHCTIVMICLY
ncbi:hypothetical protein [Mesorhizobium sp. M0159]|uniref:hypothetical protein n=1 Tax=unclassified Mesorhizobium TaxID=325217 RepID=UPI00333C6A7B